MQWRHQSGVERNRRRRSDFDHQDRMEESSASQQPWKARLYSKKDVLSPLNYQRSKSPVWHPRFSSLLLLLVKRGKLPRPAWCRVERSTEDERGRRGQTQLSLLSFPTTPQARVGPAGRNIGPGAGKEENLRADAHSRRLGGRMGHPTIQTSLPTSFTDIFPSPAAHAAVPVTTWGRCGQLHCLPF